MFKCEHRIVDVPIDCISETRPEPRVCPGLSDLLRANAREYERPVPGAHAFDGERSPLRIYCQNSVLDSYSFRRLRVGIYSFE